MTNEEKLRALNHILEKDDYTPTFTEMLTEYRNIIQSRYAAETGASAEAGTHRAEILREAADIVCGDRNNQYGEPEDSFAVISAFWTAYLTAATHAAVTVSPSDAANMMALLKIARAAGGYKADSYVDLAGYAACAGELAAKENRHGA